MASRGKRYTEEQIIVVRKEAAAGGAAVGEVIRRHGVSPQTYYAWKAKYAGMEVSEARRRAAVTKGVEAKPNSQIFNVVEI